MDGSSEHRAEAPRVTSVILDGAAIIQMLKPGAVKTFNEYYKQVFMPYVSSQHSNSTRLDLVWDRYLANSLKGTARAKRGKGIRRRVNGSVVIPGNWQDFLRSDANKMELFSFLSQQLVVAFNDEGKELVAMLDEQVLTAPLRQDMSSIAPCSHEEADTWILLHAADAVKCGHKEILIRTVDTDVVVIAVMVAQILQLNEMWVAFGTGKSFRYIAAHEIATSLGLALPMFHALTGCDTVSSFAGALSISQMPSEIGLACLEIERFVKAYLHNES